MPSGWSVFIMQRSRPSCSTHKRIISHAIFPCCG
ncbi:hypothetical protein FPL17_18485 [Acinetobacter dispersus]|nr:hypothetical protein FPL17_18485 [Acinetobacter dispersus]